VLTLGCAVAVQTAMARRKSDDSKDRRVDGSTGCMQRKRPLSFYFICSRPLTTSVEVETRRQSTYGSTVRT